LLHDQSLSDIQANDFTNDADTIAPFNGDFQQSNFHTEGLRLPPTTMTEFASSDHQEAAMILSSVGSLDTLGLVRVNPSRTRTNAITISGATTSPSEDELVEALRYWRYEVAPWVWFTCHCSGTMTNTLKLDAMDERHPLGILVPKISATSLAVQYAMLGLVTMHKGLSEFISQHDEIRIMQFYC